MKLVLSILVPSYSLYSAAFNGIFIEAGQSGAYFYIFYMNSAINCYLFFTYQLYS